MVAGNPSNGFDSRWRYCCGSSHYRGKCAFLLCSAARVFGTAATPEVWAQISFQSLSYRANMPIALRVDREIYVTAPVLVVDVVPARRQLVCREVRCVALDAYSEVS